MGRRFGDWSEVPTVLLEDKYRELGGDQIEQRAPFMVAFKASIKIELQERRNRAIIEENVKIAAEKFAEAQSRVAQEKTAEILAEEEKQRIHDENIHTEEEIKKIEEEAREDDARLKKAERERIECLQKSADAEIKAKDQLIEEYKKSVEEYKEGLEEKQNAIQLQKLCTDYIELAKQNEYLMDLLNHFVQHPVDPLLIRATMDGDLERAEAAIKLGANVNALDPKFETPLHKACAANNLQMVGFLLSHRADANIKNTNGFSAKELSTNIEITQLINQERPQGVPYDLLQEKIKNLPLSDDDLNNTLYAACKNGDSDIVEKILEYKLDAHAANFDYNVALQSTNDARIIALLRTAKVLADFSNSKVKSVSFLLNPLASSIEPELASTVNSDEQIAIMLKEILQETLESYVKTNDIDPSELSQHLVAFFPFRGDATDQSHHGNNGDVRGAKLVQDRFGSENSAYHFDGRSFIWGKAKNFPHGDRTISLWFKPDIVNVNSKTDRCGTLFGYSGIKKGIFGRTEEDNNTNLVIGLNRALHAYPNRENNIDAYVWGLPKDVEITSYQNMYGSPSVWNHLVLTSNKEHGMSIYLNGQKIMHNEQSLQNNTDITDFSIGSWVLFNSPGSSQDDPMFIGDIDEVRVYDRNLIDKEIEFLFKQPTKDTAETLSQQIHLISDLIQFINTRFIDKEKREKVNPVVDVSKSKDTNSTTTKLSSNPSTLFSLVMGKKMRVEQQIINDALNTVQRLYKNIKH